MYVVRAAMRTLVHLRHSERVPGGHHLSDAGVRLARRAGARLPRFDRVMTSPKPRAVETAEAMGYHVDAELEELEGLPGPIERWVEREAPRSFADYLALTDSVVEAGEHARALARNWRRELEHLPDGGRLLLVSHGGVVELGAVGAVGAASRAWGPSLGLLEGVELELEHAAWRGARVLRQPF